MSYTLILGGNSAGAAINKALVSVSGPSPSPDASKGWATQWIVVDGWSEAFVGWRIGEGVVGGSLEGIRTVNGATLTHTDLEAWKVAIRKVKASHVHMPFLAVFMRGEGLDPNINDGLRPQIEDWSAKHLPNSLILEIDGA